MHVLFSRRFARFLQALSIPVAGASVFLAGCGSGVKAVSNAIVAPAQIQGSVQGGLQPVSGASIMIYAASTSGRGTSATRMLAAPLSSGTNGSFSVPADFKCNNASDQIYVVASGGNPGGGVNSTLALMTDLGTCSKITPSTSIYINENTTIATVYALATYLNGTTFDIAANSSESTAIANGYSAAATLVNFTSGAALSSSAYQAKLNSLADSLASCVNSATNSNACRKFYAAATPSSSSPTPANTIAAILNIAQNPTNNVVPIYDLASATPFQPALSAPPVDWTLFPTAAAPATTLIAPIITWGPPAAISYGTALSSAQLNATSSVAGTFSYSPALGAVLNAGVQTLSVSFTPTDTATYSTATALVALTVNKVTPTLVWSNPAPISAGTALTSAQLNATSSVPGTFLYTPAAGTIPNSGTQALSVTFVPTDTTDYTVATKTVSLVVGSGSSNVAWAAPAPISYGTVLSSAQLNATASVPGTFVYNPAIGTVLNAGSQTLSVTFTPTDTVNYQASTASVALTVNKATPAISWSAPGNIAYGTALSSAQLNATASVPGTLVYSPSAGAILNAGVQTLSVTFTPTDTTNYSVVSKTVNLTVDSATSPLSWPAPAAISYGTALSSAQLNATSSIPGTFSYNPSIGTVLPAGTQSLSVIFTPTDLSTYKVQTASVSLVVNKATPAITWPTPSAISYGTVLSSTQLAATSSVPGVFSYSPAAGTTPSTGTQTLSVTFTPTDTTNYTIATKSVSLSVTGGVATVTWPAPAAITYGTALSATQLNATASIPGTFAYSPAAGAVLGAGSQSLTATFTPNDTVNYAVQTSSVSLVVNKATPAITWAAPASIAYGTVISGTQLNASANTPGAFVYSPPAGSVLPAGTSTLSTTFTPTDTANYTTATKSVSLTVNGGSASVSWPAPAAITYGTALSSAQLNATSSVPGTFAYSPALGTVLNAGSQTLSVTFTPTDTVNYTTQTISVGLQVNKVNPSITWATPAAIAYGSSLTTAQLNATSSVAGAFTYSPALGSTPNAGTQTLTATFTPTDTTNYSTQTATVSLIVNKAVPNLAWGNPAGITYGTALSSAQLNAVASVPGTLLYSPAAGTVPSVGTQTLSVTFTPTDSTNFASVSKSVSLVVTGGTATLTWATPASITYGTALSATQLNATASVPGTFVYSPALGTTPTAGTQTLSVTFTPTDTVNYTTKTATVTLFVGQATPTVTWSNPAAIGYGTALSSTQLNATASVPGTLTYSPASGTTLGVGTQTLSVTFNPTDTLNYTTKTSTVSLVVSKAVPTLTWATPASITSGTALSATQLNATVSVPGTFVYSPAAGSTPAAGAQTLNVTFTPTDTVNYATATKSVTLNVTGVATITWATPAAISYGTALSATQLNATASVPGTFSYSPASGAVLAVGTQTLTVTFTPTDTVNYTTKTATVSLVVNKATPVITWATPAAITSGTVLSATQLNATASVAGSFVYTPASGTTPAAGTNVLSVTFTPTNTTNYTTATATVSLVVNGGTQPNATNIDIGTTVKQTGMKRLGINIDGQNFYDSNQQLKNLVSINPGFEGQIWQSVLHCVQVTTTTCTDGNIYSPWVANFLQGASFEFIYGAAIGQTGTVTASSTASFTTSTTYGVTITFAALPKAPQVGDYLVVRMTNPGGAEAGWWPSLSGGTLSTEFSDLSPNTVGKQALRITAAGSGQSAQIASYFDVTNGRSFVQLKGAYQLTFRAKGAGGNNQLGINLIRSLAGGNETFVNQNLTLSGAWQDYSFSFTAAEDGSQIGGLALKFSVAGGNVLLDDVSLAPATQTSANPTPFRDEVVSTLQALHPGVLRYNDGAIMGSTIDNAIAPVFARQRAGASGQVTQADSVAIGLHEFLQLCAVVGAEPYFNMPIGMTPTEAKNLIEYFAGDASTPYGAKRAARGQTAPWTSVFPMIHLELGNEEWNGIFPGIMMQSGSAYPQRAGLIFGAAKSSSSYIASKFDLVLGGWAANPQWTNYEALSSSNFDSISAAPYLFGILSDTSSNEAIFGPMFAQPESVDSVSSGYMYQQVQYANSMNSNIVIYEVNLTTLNGTASQDSLNAVVPSVGAGLTVAEHMLLMMRDLGIKTQNLWALGEYANQFYNSNGGTESSPLFGAVIDMGGQSNLRRPTFLTEQLANTAILPTMLTTTVTGANPTWNQPLSANDDVQLNGAHYLQSFAFTDGAHQRSVVVFNLSRTGALPVTFSGVNSPTGSVNIGQVTSANLTDTNESTATVNITNTAVANFQGASQYSLPPFSMTVFTWQQ